MMAPLYSTYVDAIIATSCTLALISAKTEAATSPLAGRH
jgi:hypothetical protein